MCVFVSPSKTAAVEAPTRRTIQTTLYDLITAVDEAMPPGEEDLVTPIVLGILRSGKVTFLGEPEDRGSHEERSMSSPLTN